MSDTGVWGWGPRPVAEGRWCFRLWAPAAARVALLLDGEPIAMQADAEGEGWYSVEAQCSAGAPYRFLIDDTDEVPDPASRWQPHGVDGASAVPVAAGNFQWTDSGWSGRAWETLVIYEVHVGCSGGYAGLRAQLPALAAMGITALELMPVAQFPGRRNWGYDGVFPYAPAECYGRPDDLKALIDAAHGLGLAVLLDVVYNHFGPQGNHLARYAPAFFSEGTPTPWGAAIDFAQPAVQQFFIDNALMWLQEYRFDGLRLDAVHAIAPQAFLAQLEQAIREATSAGRQIHLVLENEANQAHWLESQFRAQWNDDFHNALHVMLTDETEGYYAEQAGPGRAASLLARVLQEGFAWQGGPTRSGHPRGEPSGHLPPDRFVVFAQNHDQIGNRAFGDRLVTQLDRQRAQCALALPLLTPMIPLVFMGEPWGSRTPFQFFTDYLPPLDEAVREGRRSEFSQFSAFADASQRARIPDPNDPATMNACRVALPADDDADAQAHLAWFGAVLELRRQRLQPSLAAARSLGARALGPKAVQAGWALPEGQWWIALNVGADAVEHGLPDGEDLLVIGSLQDDRLHGGGSFCVRWVAV